MAQAFYESLRPASQSPKDLMIYCVKKAISSDLLTESYTHAQWANLLFRYEKNSSMRTDMMSEVKREYPIYFSRLEKGKYSFEEDKLMRDFPYLFGIQNEKDDDEGYTCEEIVEENISSLSKEIAEQKDIDNIEHYKGINLLFLNKQTKSFIHQVSLILPDGQEPHVHEGDPFKLKTFGNTYICEVVDFDFESGTLFFTANHKIGNASYCTILLDSTFILEGLINRLQEIAINGVDENLPFTKFMFEETEDIVEIPHKSIPDEMTKNLDDAQKEAFYAALDNDITFIWGPPGTGKSYTLASIIYTLFKLKEDKTAVCCLSNVAVDQLLNKLVDRIEEEGSKIECGEIYRAGHSRDERILATDYLFPKDEKSKSLRKEIKKNTDKLKILKWQKMDMSERAILLKTETRDLREQLKEHTEYLVNNSSLVFSTISNFILSKKLNNIHFDNLIVDEASMLAMPSLIALASKITKRLIMVGDFQQLSPIAMVNDSNLKNSVFDLANINIGKFNHPGLYMLLNQRRSNEKIVSLFNDTFYNGKLVAKVKGSNEIISSEPFPNKTIAIANVSDSFVRFTKGGTRQNEDFAYQVMLLLDNYAYSDGNFSIGVITPYKGQASLIRALLHEREYPEDFNRRVKVGTVHTFQGSECDVIIFDTVDCGILESGKKTGIGKIYASLEGERLLNVAISRAKHKLIIVCERNFIYNVPGNTITLKTRKVFSELCKFSY